MKPVYTHVFAATAVLVVGAAAAVALFAWSGAYNFAADEPHTAAVSAFIDVMRDRSVQSRAQRLQMPDLTDMKRIVQGSGNYNAMCTGCHLAPAMAESELSKGLYPAPPNLSTEKVEPGEAFWVIKHGIKASGMPAWGASMSDEDIWNIAAFLQALPGLDEGKYKAMVASSGGHHHDHGGAHDEDADHGHEQGEAAHGHGEKAEADHAHEEAVPDSEPGTAAPRGAQTHVHADGTQHAHMHSQKGAVK